jgi:hypothetical protein
LPTERNLFKLRKDAFKRYIEWTTLDLAKKIFIFSFIFINILAIVINFKKISDNFNPTFIKNINWAWVGMWSLVAGTKLFDFIFRRRLNSNR